MSDDTPQNFPRRSSSRTFGSSSRPWLPRSGSGPALRASGIAVRVDARSTELPALDLTQSDIEQGPQRPRGSCAAFLCACLLSGSRLASPTLRQSGAHTPSLVGSASFTQRHTVRTITHDVYALPDVVVLGLERLRRLIAHPCLAGISARSRLAPETRGAGPLTNGRKFKINIYFGSFFISFRITSFGQVGFCR